MKYKIIETGVEFPASHLPEHFPYASLPPTLSTDDLAFLGLVVVPDEEPLPLTPEELASQEMTRQQQFQKDVVDTLQARLDAFAHTRSYDSILSACTYANSLIPRFRADGQCCVNIRDASWEALYNLLNEVKDGVKPMPSSVEDVLSTLPAMEWTN